MQLALFDLDGTLIPWDSQVYFANYVLQRYPAQRRYIVKYLASLSMCWSRRARNGLLKRSFLGYTKGLSRATLNELAEGFQREVISKVLYAELLKRLRWHQQQGHRCLLVSASPDFYACAIGEALGFDAVYATAVEWKERARVFLPLGSNKHAGKVSRLQAAGELERLGECEQVWGYSDSPADLPMLELCSKVCCVNPGGKLSAIAAQRGWEVLRVHAAVPKGLRKLTHELGLACGMKPK